MCSPQSGTPRDSELHREEKREEGDRGDQEEKRGSQKEERAVKPVISSPSVLHSPEYPKRFTELSREEKGEGGVSNMIIVKYI